jgi:hypothetical protein
LVVAFRRESCIQETAAASSTGPGKTRCEDCRQVFGYLECCWLCHDPSLLAGCLPNISTLPSCELTQLHASLIP